MKETLQAYFSALAFGADHFVGKITSEGPDNGMTVFAPFVVPQQETSLEVIERKKSLLFALPNEPALKGARCSLYGTCGGCSLQHLSLKQQRQLKHDMVNSALEKKLRVSLGERLQVLEDLQTGFEYRNRVTVHFSENGKFGFFKRASHEVVPVHSCPISEDAINEVLNALGSLSPSNLQGIEQAEIRSGEPCHISFRVLQGAQFSTDQFETVKQSLAAFATCSFSETGLTPGSFRQVNEVANRELVALVGSLLSGEEILELYSGDGNLTETYASRCTSAVCVERDRSLVAQAKERASRNGWGKRIRIVRGTAEEYLRKNRSLQTVLIDPPRSGAKEASKILSAHPCVSHIVYVSCSLATWLRDCEKLLEGGFTLEQVHLVDMFPQTHYIEIVSSLRRDDTLGKQIVKSS